MTNTRAEILGALLLRITLGNKNLTIGVDHKPLVSIRSDRNLELIKNLRLRNLKDKMLM